jgi:hypothetical protein
MVFKEGWHHMSTNNTGLSKIMNVFSVNGLELYKVLNVDSSLISKWKNGSRMLSHQSDYLKDISNFFMDLDSGSKYQRIKEILLPYYPNISVEKPEKLVMYLSQWLAKGYVKNNTIDMTQRLSGNSYSSCFMAFSGNTGRREAVNLLLDKALEMPEKKNLFIISQDNTKWFFENAKFTSEFVDKIRLLAEKDIKITIIHTVDRNANELKQLTAVLLPPCLLGFFRGYYYLKYMDMTQ